MTFEQVLIWGAIAGLYGWQFVHGRWCADWRTRVSEKLGRIEASLGLKDQ